MKRFLSILIVIMMMIGSCVPALAEDMVSAAMIIRMPGGGTVAIEGEDLGEVLKIPAEAGEITYEFAPHKVGSYYYKVTQILGSDPTIVYDETEYTVCLYAYYDNGELVASIIAQKGDEKTKPKEIAFYNLTEETITITRTIYYDEYVEDGKEVAKEVVQKATLKRTGSYEAVEEDEPGAPDDGYGSRSDKDSEAIGTATSGDWGISTASASGMADKPILTLKNPVSFVAKDELVFSQWEIVSADTSAVKSPDHPKKDSEGWTPNIEEVPEWSIDWDNPHDEAVYVIYTPKKGSDTPDKPSGHGKSNTSGRSSGDKGPKTGDEANPTLYIAAMGVALVTALVLRKIRKE